MRQCPEGVCHNCGELGHWRDNCPQEQAVVHLAQEYMVHTIEEHDLEEPVDDDDLCNYSFLVRANEGWMAITNSLTCWCCGQRGHPHFLCPEKDKTSPNKWSDQSRFDNWKRSKKGRKGSNSAPNTSSTTATPRTIPRTPDPHNATATPRILPRAPDPHKTPDQNRDDTRERNKVQPLGRKTFRGSPLSTGRSPPYKRTNILQSPSSPGVRKPSTPSDTGTSRRIRGPPKAYDASLGNYVMVLDPNTNAQLLVPADSVWVIPDGAGPSDVEDVEDVEDDEDFCQGEDQVTSP